MHDILVQRLEMTLAMAKAQPDSLIVLTGGVPRNHKTEGKLMADWLVEKGIARDRIIEDNYARSTVENALYSSYALARHDIDHATIISSASHVRRGQSLFEIASCKQARQTLRSTPFQRPTSLWKSSKCHLKVNCWASIAMHCVPMVCGATGLTHWNSVNPDVKPVNYPIKAAIWLPL